MQSDCLETKEAAGRAATTATKKQTAAYPSGSLLSTPPHRNSPRVPNWTDQALGALLIYLLSQPLPQAERVLGWRIAERWLGELADHRLAGGVA